MQNSGLVVVVVVVEAVVAAVDAKKGKEAAIEATGSMRRGATCLGFPMDGPWCRRV